MEWMIENWEYVLIGVMAVDKAVALSPSTWMTSYGHRLKSQSLN